jgi:uncharacterized OB-fold protein
MTIEPSVKIPGEIAQTIADCMDYKTKNKWEIIYTYCRDCGSALFNEKTRCPRCGSTQNGYIL